MSAYFHHDYYIESLLLVINNISFNALDGAEKIRTIVEKMIEGLYILVIM